MGNHGGFQLRTPPGQSELRGSHFSSLEPDFGCNPVLEWLKLGHDFRSHKCPWVWAAGRARAPLFTSFLLIPPGEKAGWGREGGINKRTGFKKKKRKRRKFYEKKKKGGEKGDVAPQSDT